MSGSDKQVSGALAVIVVTHAAILITALVSSYFVLVVYLNLAVSLSLLLYWVQKQIRITQHIFDQREMIVVGFEAAVAGCSVFTLFHATEDWLRITHVTCSVIHLLAAIALLIFMLTFKIKRLF